MLKMTSFRALFCTFIFSAAAVLWWSQYSALPPVPVASRSVAPKPSEGGRSDAPDRTATAPAPSPQPVSGQARVAGDKTLLPSHVVAATADRPEDVFGEFKEWSRKYKLARTPAEKAALEATGQEVAAKRREALYALIKADPERALAKAVSAVERAVLPANIIAKLETAVSARGDFEVRATTPARGEGNGTPSVQRFAVIGGARYNACVYGRRVTMTTKENIPLHGIVIDNAMAIAASPVRELEPGEAASAASPALASAGVCTVCGQPGDPSLTVDVGGEPAHFCLAMHKASYVQGLEAAEKGIGPKSIPFATYPTTN